MAANRPPLSTKSQAASTLGPMEPWEKRIALSSVVLIRSIGLACAAVSGFFYLLFGLLGRLVTPWSKGRTA